MKKKIVLFSAFTLFGVICGGATVWIGKVVPLEARSKVVSEELLGFQEWMALEKEAAHAKSKSSKSIDIQEMYRQKYKLLRASEAWASNLGELEQSGWFSESEYMVHEEPLLPPGAELGPAPGSSK